MTINPTRESAQIFQFPARGRFAPATQTASAVQPVAPSRRVASGEAWYHDEAIQDAEQPRKN